MRRAAIMAMVVTTPIAALAYQNEPTGFRGLEWDIPLEGVTEQLTNPLTTRDTTIAERKGDKLAIGEAQLKSINYFFYKGRLQGVMISTEPGAHNVRAIRDALVAQFGPPSSQPNRFMARYHWLGQVTNIYLDCFEQRDRCTVTIRSQVVSARQIADKREAAKEAKKDF